MASTKHSKVDDWRNVIDKVHASLSKGTAYKLFEDDYFVYELIKLLYEETLEVFTKIEILTVIEQWGSAVLPTNSIDQAITALLDVLRVLDSSPGSMSVGVQLLLTVTTLFIEHEELLGTELCTTYLSVLTNLVTKVNNINTRRLRACACQCLAQIESWKPGLLWRYRETFANLVKEERTDVCQDYMQLLITVTINTDQLEKEEQESLISETGKKKADSHVSAREGRDVLSMVSLIMDNLFVLTPTGLLSVACSVVQLVKGRKDILPNVFKPLMLQCLPSRDPCVVFMMLFLQKEFRREILTDSEEHLLLRRVVEVANHPSTKSYARLLLLEWLLSYLQETDLMSSLVQLKGALCPVVFDPLDVHTRKVSLLAHCSGSGLKEDLPRDLHYLTQVAMTTGGMRVATALYHVLYLHVESNSCDAVHDHVLRTTRKLFQSFPHLIPLIVDFLRAVKTSQPHSKFHSEILTLLHETVLSLPVSQLLNNYQNYLHVWILSAQETYILQQKPLRRMLDIVKEAVTQALDSWDLGCLILSICRTMILHHHTDILYSQMGDLLCFLMKEYGDTDIRDNARLYYALLTLNSDSKAKEILGASVTESLHLGENIADFFPGFVNHTLPAEINLLAESPIIWQREQLEIVFASGGEKKEYTFSQPVTDGLEDYWQRMLCLRTSLTAIMRANITGESDYDNLLAVSFHASEHQNLQLNQDVYFPYLSKGDLARVTFQVNIQIPEPVAIPVRAAFGCSKVTCECELTPLKFGLQDFLIAFPWHQFDITDRQQFFSQHWNNYTQKSASKSQGVESVKILKCSRQTLMDVWRPAWIDNADDHTDIDDYLFFLPPRFHLLFHVQTRPTHLVVHIATDYWPVLAYLDDYLSNLIS
ncbi:hypothetical protein BsWGS_00985 [Bradybaena similaris]